MIAAPDNVIDLVDEETVAFDHFADWARALLVNPGVILDREWNEELERRRAKWLRLFTINSGGLV